MHDGDPIHDEGRSDDREVHRQNADRVRGGTVSARSSLFPVGRVYSTVTPAMPATTYLFEDVKGLLPLDGDSLGGGNADPYADLFYGGVDTPTTRHLAGRIAALEKGCHAVLSPSGTSAIFATLSSLAGAGDHVLVADTAVYSTRWLLDRALANFGVVIEYFDPDAVEDLHHLIRPETRAIFAEAPAAFTYLPVDVSPIVDVCRERQITSVIDNTWAAFRYFDAFAAGFDVSVLSLGKTIGAVSGVSMGAAVTRRTDLHGTIKDRAALHGAHVSPQPAADLATALTTLEARLDRQEVSAKHLIDSLLACGCVGRLYHPSMNEGSRASLFDRLFKGANPILSIALESSHQDALDRLSRLKVVNAGYGWGGAVSLLSPFDTSGVPGIDPDWARFPHFRISVGLEDPDDIAGDLISALGQNP